MGYHHVNIEEKISRWISRLKNRREADSQTIKSIHAKWGREDLVVATKANPVLKIVTGWSDRPPWETISPLSDELKYFWQIWDQLRKDEDALLWYKWLDSSTLQRKLLMVTRN